MLINFKIFNSDKLKQEYKIIIAVKTKQENYIVFRNTLKEISCFLFYSLTSQIHSLGRIRTILKHFDLKIVFICVVSLQRRENEKESEGDRNKRDKNEDRFVE